MNLFYRHLALLFGFWSPRNLGLFPVTIVFESLTRCFQAHFGDQLKARSWTTITSLFRNEGLSGFYRGAGPILFRAVPANAAGLLGYELAISFFAGMRAVDG